MKTGRKPKHFNDPDTGLPVVGLTRRPDGRWRVIGTHQTFREPDPKKAIRRFYDLTDARVKGEVAGIPIDCKRSELEALADELDRFIKANELAYWQRVASDIIKRPQYVAEHTGIEKIGYLTDLRPPAILPELSELKTTWDANELVAGEQKRKVSAAWEDFLNATGVRGLREITPKIVRAYRQEVWKRCPSGKAQLNQFSNLRRMVSYNIEEGDGDDDGVTEVLEKILARLKNILKPNETTVCKRPTIIDPADWAKLLSKAVGDDLAFILSMLNFAMTTTEVVRLRWEDVDLDAGTLVTRRHKTGRKVRVAILWPETVVALRGLERKGEWVFYSKEGTRLSTSGAEKRWRKLRHSAGVEHVKAKHLRSSAYSAASNGQRGEDRFVKAYGGHGCGMSDHYVMSHPGIVTDCCAAVHARYMRPSGQVCDLSNCN